MIRLADAPERDGVRVWINVEAFIRSIRETRWDRRTWPEAKVTLGRALALRERLRRGVWWN